MTSVDTAGPDTVVRARGSGPTARVHLLGRATPSRIRLLAGVTAFAVAGLAALLLVQVDRARASLTTIGGQAAPEVTAASDLYFALNDLDAQLANVLLVGDATDLGISRAQALDLYEQRRTQADRDIRVAASSATDVDTTRAVDDVLDSYGRYQALAARAILLDQQGTRSPARPSAATIAGYRAATDLSRTRLLPAARRLAEHHGTRLETTYRASRSQILSTRGWVLGAGAVALGAIIWLQVYLARRFRRVIAPALVGASVLVAIGLLMAVILLTGLAEHLRVAKKDAFDSLLALNTARAVSYDANADESRFLLDPGRAEQYQQAFLSKSQQIVQVPGATISTWDSRLALAVDAYQRRPSETLWDGYLGTEFRNITFTGERAAAETTLHRYQVYQLDDRRIRALSAAGHLDEAVALCTEYSPGGSNYAFDQYDQALSAVIAINQKAFDEAIDRGQHSLRGWTIGLWTGGLAVLLLLWRGTARRLNEYRPATAMIR
jgi:hypothetical protein